MPSEHPVKMPSCRRRCECTAGGEVCPRVQDCVKLLEQGGSHPGGERVREAADAPAGGTERSEGHEPTKEPEEPPAGKEENQDDFEGRVANCADGFWVQ